MQILSYYYCKLESKTIIMNPAEFYLKTIYKKSKFYGTWPPNTPMKLGMIGVLNGYEFKQITSLRDFGIETKTTPLKKSSKTDYSFISNIDISFKSILAADVEQIAKADIDIKFTRNGAFLFEACGCIVTELSNKYNIGLEIKKLFKDQRWKHEWVIVDRLIHADASTIMISSSEKSQLGLSVKDKAKKIILTDASIGLSTEYKSGELSNIIAIKELTPLFGISKIKQSFLQRLLNVRDKAKFCGPSKNSFKEDSNIHIFESPEEDIWEEIIPSDNESIDN